jgi:hypothetical protein
LVEFFPENRAVEDPNAPLIPGAVADIYAHAIATVSSAIERRIDLMTGLLKSDHLFCVVYRRSSDRESSEGDYGLIPSGERQKSNDAVAAGMKLLGFDRPGQEEKISLFQDAIELNANNLQAYLEIVKVCVVQSIDTDFHHGRKYYLNLFFRLYAAVLYLDPVLKLGDPERQSAFRIWDKFGVYIANHMKSIARVRHAFSDYPTQGFIGEVHSLADTMGLKGLLPLQRLSPEMLRWLHLPETERLSREELILLAPNMQYLPLSDYFRRRFPAGSPLGSRVVTERQCTAGYGRRWRINSPLCDTTLRIPNTLTF